jgi:hypothetical protein
MAFAPLSASAIYNPDGEDSVIRTEDGYQDIVPASEGLDIEPITGDIEPISEEDELGKTIIFWGLIGVGVLAFATVGILVFRKKDK